jgi:hypothetical protein
VNSDQRLAQWNLQLDAICGKVVKQPKRLTGVEKEALEVEPIEPIEEEYQRVFGQRKRV